MPFIEISNNGFPILEKIVREAEKYLYVISFLFYDEKLCNLLVEKQESFAVPIEVFTTPPEGAEAFHLKDVATQIQNQLQAAGIKVIPCDWEVGQPELTTSTRAGGRVPRWFAMHAKCIVTDKHALITSADITPTYNLGGDWNTYVTYTEPERILLLRQKYEKLKDFFSDVPSHLGTDFIDRTVPTRKLIMGYPYKEPEESLLDGFYFLPNEGYGRKIIQKAINDSEEYIYCGFETFYDDNLAFSIMRKLIHSPYVDFRLISSPLTEYVQNPAKARATFVQLASYGAKIRTLKGIRAKIMVTDKTVLSGSFDLAKMGVGTIRSVVASGPERRRLKVWVESTEIMDVNTSREFIDSAKNEFLELYNTKAVEEYGIWFVKDAEKTLRSAGAMTISRDAKEILGSMIFNEGRKSSERIKKISFISVEIARLQNPTKPYAKAETILNAERLILMQERNELNAESTRSVLGILNAGTFLERLKEYRIIT